MRHYPKVRRWSTALGLSLVAIGAGCLKHTSDGHDGSTCEASTDCDSKTCTFGTCAGKACDDDPKVCDPGWVCYSPSVSDLGRVLGEDDSSRCKPTCDACPSTMHCPVFGGYPATTASDGADAAIYCEDGPPRTGTIAGPDMVVAGSIATFAVTFAPAHDFELYEWSFGLAGEGPELQAGIAQDGGTAGVSISAAEEGDAIVAVQASDVNRTKDPSMVLPTAEATRKVHVTCTPKGGDCSTLGSCCQVGSSCDYDTSGGTCM